MTDTAPVAPAPISDSQRSDILAREVAAYARKGYATESISATSAVVVKTKRIGIFWNVVLLFFTAGLWIIYIVYRALNRKKDRVVLFVNEFGTVERR